MRRVAKHPVIPVPRDLTSTTTARDICDADYFFMEKLAGDNLGHVKSTLSPERAPAIETRIGEILRAINGFTGTYFGYPATPTCAPRAGDPPS